MTLAQLGSVKPAAAELSSPIAAVAAGEGVALTLVHRVVDEPVQRQIGPETAVRIASSVGFG